MNHTRIKIYLTALLSMAQIFSCASSSEPVYEKHSVFDRDNRILEQIDLLLDEERPHRSTSAHLFFIKIMKTARLKVLILQN